MAALERNPVAPWQRRLLDASLWVLGMTGAAWLVAHYAFGAGNDAVGLPHASEAWWMRLHGLAAFALLIVFGAFLPLHLPRGWRIQSKRGVEMAMLVCFGGAIVSAYLLYYFAPEPLHAAMGWVHAGVGAGAVVGAAWHRYRRDLRA